MGESLEKVFLGGGCFWCVESVFHHVEGVVSAISGYAGGRRPNPTYEQVSSGATGHAEVVEVTFDSERIAFEEILRIFFATHDPTTLNRQGNDVGTQYRSVIYCTSAAQRAAAQALVTELNASGIWADPIVTEVADAPAFYRAEEYHQRYFAKNPFQPYCVYALPPKLEKLATKFPSRFLADRG